MDGNLQFGDVAVFINEQGKNTILELAPRVDELEPDVVSDLLIKHDPSGVHVLAAPQRPRVDYAGIVFVAIGSAALVLMTSWGGTTYPWGSPTIIGLLFASFGLTLLAFSVPMGAISDRVGRKAPMSGALALLAAATLLFARAESLQLLFAARMLQGAADAIAWVVGFARSVGDRSVR